MTFAFVFAGQGSQSVGMLSALAAAHPIVRETFAEASTALGYDLWRLVSEGPEEALNSTERTQPAMLAAGVAVWRVWRARGGGLPAVVSGHSLGEFTALTCAGVFEFPQAIELVRFRGQAMQEAVPAGSGAMAAILGLEDEAVAALCAEVADGEVVEAVNLNSPGQIVIAGERGAVARAIEVAKARGAKRALVLPVSVPAHSSLMRAAGERLRSRLAALTLREPGIAYLSAVDAREHSDAAEIRELLVRQISSPVRWTDTVRALAGRGIAQLIECAPGKVLTGLNRRIERRAELAVLSIEDPASIDRALSATASGEAHA
jgi:[acyl-carrier-protein] S-malonyltransferase